MPNPNLKQTIGWGLLLWLIGYILGIVFFMLMPPALVGWAIMPIGIALTLWVLFKKISGGSLAHYFQVGIIWALIAIVCDYLFLVLLFKPADGYYKLDVYIYYAVTLVLPIVVGYIKARRTPAAPAV